MDKNAKIYVAGHKGLAGSAITRALESKGYSNIITRTHAALDLLDQKAVADFFLSEKPDYVFLAAAKVGGIVANNTYRAQFLYENLQIQNNILHESYKNNVKKLLFLGSSCIYPKKCAQPMKEEYLLTDELEYTNEPYAVAKIAGMKMCESYNIQYNTEFIPVMPTNLYGPNDNYDLNTSHVLAALIRKIHLATCLQNGDIDAIRSDLNKRPVDNTDESANKKDILETLKNNGISGQSPVVLKLWGTGNPKREFLHASDLADACLFLMQKTSFADLTKKLPSKEIKNTHVNIGTGKDISIKELSSLIGQIAGFNGKIAFNPDMPDGTPVKLLDITKLEKIGWKSNITLHDGLEMTYNNYKHSVNSKTNK